MGGGASVGSSSQPTEAIVAANRRWVASPWGIPRSQPVSATWRRGRDPDRPVEGAGDVGRDHLGDLDRRLGAADLRELDPGQRQAPIATARSASARLATLSSAGDRDRGRRRRPRPPPRTGDRLLGELEVELLELAERPLRRLDVPGAVGVDPDPGLGADRLANRPHLAEVVARPELQLERVEPSSAQARASAATSAGSPAERVALQRTGAGGAAGARAPPRPFPEVEQRGQRRAPGRRRELEAPREGLLIEAVGDRPAGPSSATTSPERRRRRAGSAAPLRRARRSPPRRAASAAPSRAARGFRRRSRTAAKGKRVGNDLDARRCACPSIAPGQRSDAGSFLTAALALRS